MNTKDFIIHGKYKISNVPVNEQGEIEQTTSRNVAICFVEMNYRDVEQIDFLLWCEENKERIQG